MNTKVLELSFKLSNDKTMTISIANPKDTLTESDINMAMNTIVSSNYFSREGNTIVAKKQARFVERNVTEVEIV